MHGLESRLPEDDSSEHTDLEASQTGLLKKAVTGKGVLKTAAHAYGFRRSLAGKVVLKKLVSYDQSTYTMIWICHYLKRAFIAILL